MEKGTTNKYKDILKLTYVRHLYFIHSKNGYMRNEVKDSQRENRTIQKDNFIIFQRDYSARQLFLDITFLTFLLNMYPFCKYNKLLSNQP